MKWFVRRRIDDSVVTFDMVEDAKAALALCKKYAYDHRDAYGNPLSQVTKIKNGRQTVGYKTRRSTTRPFVQYVAESGKRHQK